MLLSSLFEDVQLIINDKVVEGGNYLYPYTAYMSSMLNYSDNANNSWMSAMGYQKDEAEKYDSKENSGHLARAKEIGSIFELIGPLYLSIFQQSKYMLPKVNLRKKMTRSKPDFYLMNFGDANVKLEIMESWVRVRSVFVKPAVSLGHEDGLKHYNTIYTLQRSKLNIFTLRTDA